MWHVSFNRLIIIHTNLISNRRRVIVFSLVFFREFSVGLLLYNNVCIYSNYLEEPPNEAQVPVLKICIQILIVTLLKRRNSYIVICHCIKLTTFNWLNKETVMRFQQLFWIFGLLGKALIIFCCVLLAFKVVWEKDKEKSIAPKNWTHVPAVMLLYIIKSIIVCDPHHAITSLHSYVCMICLNYV